MGKGLFNLQQDVASGNVLAWNILYMLSPALTIQIIAKKNLTHISKSNKALNLQVWLRARLRSTWPDRGIVPVIHALRWTGWGAEGG